MSKQSSLLNYFKSPKAMKPNDDEKPTTSNAKAKASTPKRAPRNKGNVKGKENNAGGTPKRKRPINKKGGAINKDNTGDNAEVEDSPVKPKRRRIIVKEDDSDDENDEDSKMDEEKKISDVSPMKPKRKRNIIIPDIESGDESDEFVPDPDETISESECSEGEQSSLYDTETETDEDSTPKKSRRGGRSSNTTSNSKKPKTNKNDEVVTEEQPTAEGRGSSTWLHLTYDFLKPEKICDANRRRPDHPNYNPKTLYVPESFLNNLSPAMRQWWVLKSQHYDCVLFFKVGKFYELYHMDAVTAASELNISYMRGNWAHSGFPEIGYGRFSGMLIEKGYKVARIEQTETPEMMQNRCKTTVKSTKFDKVVRREICQITNRALRVPTVQDEQLVTPYSNYLLSLVEKVGPSQLSTYGVCFVDTTTGVFNLGQFEDDISQSRLLTLLSHCSPLQIIYERASLSRNTMKILNDLSSIIKEPLQKDVEFWSAMKTLKVLHEAEYFKYESDNFTWPEGLKPFLSPSDHLGLTPSEDKELAVNALGGCLYILKDYFLDEQLLAQKNFQTYVPPDMTISRGIAGNNMPASMVLDAITVSNLNILGKTDSLLHLLDHCCTAFGKRLLKEWVCRPSCQKNLIVQRQNAITELMDRVDVTRDAKKLLTELPDLERLLSKVHAHGNAARLKNHPDGRACMFESNIYNKRKIEDFIIVLGGFSNIIKITQLFESFESKLIKQTISVAPAGDFPDLKDSVDRYKNGFDHEEARKAGCIIPKKGMDVEYDEVMVELELIGEEANAYLKKQSNHFGVNLKFGASNQANKRYQIEVPESRCHLVGSKYDLQNSRKGFKRYWTDEAKQLVERHMKAEEQRDKILKDGNRRVFANFSTEYDTWSSAVYKIAVLDALMSLAEYAKSGDMCIPEFSDDNPDKPFIDIRNGKHPCILSENFVPNDTVVGKDGIASLVIVTGPNMGGKSTIMRQVGLLIVMAQIGCHIPAESCKISLVDRIFTRLGAGDDILTSRSTFLVELSETSVILRHATKHSLVLLDELGRGTSTHDGTAIAAAVTDALTKKQCRTLFSTHYHSLVEDFKKNSNVSLAHMACQVEEEVDDVTEETITFLYKFVEGACPKSYGFNAARLAGVPLEIIKRAHEIADQLERETNRRKMFGKLWNVHAGNMKDLIAELKNTNI